MSQKGNKMTLHRKRTVMLHKKLHQKRNNHCFIISGTWNIAFEKTTTQLFQPGGGGVYNLSKGKIEDLEKETGLPDVD